MRASITRDKFRRNLYLNQEILRRTLLSIIHDCHLDPKLRRKAQFKLDSLCRNGSLTRVNRRCIITGRSKGIIRRYSISRLVFRRLATQGLLPGIIKASW